MTEPFNSAMATLIVGVDKVGRGLLDLKALYEDSIRRALTWSFVLSTDGWRAKY